MEFEVRDAGDAGAGVLRLLGAVAGEGGSGPAGGGVCGREAGAGVECGGEGVAAMSLLLVVCWRAPSGWCFRAIKDLDDPPDESMWSLERCWKDGLGKDSWRDEGQSGPAMDALLDAVAGGEVSIRKYPENQKKQANRPRPDRGEDIR
jgi:hypothetical protein